jgi:citrate lyase subunit beta/citryl-CoA lyase
MTPAPAAAGPTGRGTAGRRGDDARSDLWVELELAQEGGLALELTSRVEPYYGAAIRRQVADVVAACGVEHARVRIADQGALPFVIAARVEAAARRAGVRPAAPPPLEHPAPLPPPSARDRLRRSRLYLPGNEPKYMINAGLYEPDAVILDLEDSVHTDEKDAARLLVRNALRTIDFGRAERMVRINPLPAGLADLELVLPGEPDLILLPKVESGAQLREASAAVDRLAGGARPVWLMPILESALGVERAFEIAVASPRVVALTIGLEDHAADLGVPRTAEGEESLYARLRLINAARAAGLEAIDSVYGQVDDLEGLERWSARSRALGFAGMGCVHPRQIGPIHEAFRPSPAELARAHAIVEAWERAQAAGLAVVSVGSKMIDPPVVEQARRLVARARLAGPAARDAGSEAP